MDRGTSLAPFLSKWQSRKPLKSLNFKCQSLAGTGSTPVFALQFALQFAYFLHYKSR